MNRITRTICCGALLATAGLAVGQTLKDVSADGYGPLDTFEPPRRVAPLPRTVERPELFAADRGLHLPAVSANPALVDGPEEGAQQIGEAIEMVADPITSGAWTALEDGGMVWTVLVTSPNAQSLRIRFDDFDLPTGAELVLYDADDPTEAYGPYSRTHRRRGLPFWSPSVFSNRVRVEIYFPPALALQPGLEAPRIGAVAQEYPSRPQVALGNDCRIDVNCDATWDDPSRGVAHIRFMRGNSEFICTGSLLTRLPEFDGTPLFLTAGHCIDSEAEASSVEAYWFFETDDCNGTAADLDDVPRTDGATLLAVDGDADNSLLALLGDLPGNLFWNGWSTTNPGLGLNGTLIHHPSGTRKAISYGEFQVYTVCACGSCWNTWFFPFSNGGQEGGSSGGPVFSNAGQHVRAVASCSSNSGCGPNEWAWEGSLRHAYDVLEPFLDARDDVWVDIGHGGTERGTQAEPWDELIEGYFGVREGGNVHLVGGTYPEINFNRGRTMVFMAESGNAVIGG